MLKSKNFLPMKSELLLSGILIFLLLLFLDPFGFMAPDFVMMLVFILLIVFAVFAAMFWKEKPRDEREQMLRSLAGRYAFLAGSSVLVCGIVVQEFQHALDPWLIYALIAMIAGKIIGHMWGNSKM